MEPKVSERVQGTAAKNLPEAEPVKNVKGKVGRAPKSPDEEVLKLKTFNLPLTLINEIVEYANVNYNGNASKLAVDIFREFLTRNSR